MEETVMINAMPDSTPASSPRMPQAALAVAFDWANSPVATELLDRLEFQIERRQQEIMKNERRRESERQNLDSTAGERAAFVAVKSFILGCREGRAVLEPPSDAEKRALQQDPRRLDLVTREVVIHHRIAALQGERRHLLSTQSQTDDPGRRMAVIDAEIPSLVAFAARTANEREEMERTWGTSSGASPVTSVSSAAESPAPDAP